MIGIVVTGYLAAILLCCILLSWCYRVDPTVFGLSGKEDNETAIILLSIVWPVTLLLILIGIPISILLWVSRKVRGR